MRLSEINIVDWIALGLATLAFVLAAIGSRQ